MKKTVSPAIHLALASTIALASLNANALVISTTNNTAASMASAVLAANSGINIAAGSAAIQGTNTSTVQQYGTYSGFNLVPSKGTTPTLSMSNGVVLTTGSAKMPLTNTSTGYTGYSGSTGSGSNTALSTLSGFTTYDANVLSFNFTVAKDVTSITAKFVFGTEEFPDQNYTDIFGFFVDGVNYAKFANDALISNVPGTNNFISNTTGVYGIEYDGLTNVLSVTGLLDSKLAVHSIAFGVADTKDYAYDSGVFVNSLLANKSTTGGISDVPEPGSLALFGIALGAAAVARRRKSRG